jgi:cob(I)alamin adenosyltransferase
MAVEAVLGCHFVCILCDTYAAGLLPVFECIAGHYRFLSALSRIDMGHRLSKIVTRTGDAGTTGLGDGSRTAKDSPRIVAIGEVDELNSLLGALLCEQVPEDVRTLLVSVQHDLFDLGGELAVPGSSFLTANQPARLEEAVERYNSELKPLAEFILPGGTRPAAVTHLARAVCRRAERAVVALGAAEPVSDTARQYLNRLSDLLFVLGRWLNKAAGSGDVLWRKGKNA